MADIQNENLENDDFDTILSPNIEFTGSITFERPFLIRGLVKGTINASGLLVVDEGGRVEADIATSRVIIRGDVEGAVTAGEKVEITGTGRLRGDLSAPQVAMEAGCVYNGRCVMPERTGGL